MEDSHAHALTLIQHGCELARELQQNLPNVANQPSTLINNCEQIISVFTQAKERLSSFQENISHRFDFQDWVTTTPGYESRFHQQMSRYEPGTSNVGARVMEMPDVQSEGLAGEDVPMEPARPVQTFPLQRSRRRSEEGEKMTIKVPAPRIGNTEIPPEDGHTWRKYGQKEILGSTYPRAYFRCTHQKLYNCPAKKQVQRLDNDPTTFEVTYRGQHTCHMSPTAPSVPPPQQPPSLDDPMTQILAAVATQQSPPPSTLPQPIPWLSVVTRARGGDQGAGTSTSYGKEPMEQYGPPAVADLAEQMFNSGSSSNTNMDQIFPNRDDKWEQGDKNETNLDD